MALVKLDANLDNVETEFPLAPAGNHRARITRVEPGTSAAGKPKLVIGYTPIGEIVCKVGDKDKAISGKEIFQQSVSLQANALFTLKKVLQAAGVGWTSDGFDYSELLGKEVTLQCSQGQSDKGRTYCQVDEVLA